MNDETATIKSELERIIDEAVEERCAGLRAERDELRTELARLREGRGEAADTDGCETCAYENEPYNYKACVDCSQPEGLKGFTPKPEPSVIWTEPGPYMQPVMDTPEADCAKCADYHTSIASPPCSLCGEPCYPCFTPKPEAHPFDRWERGVESRIEALERDTHHHGPRRG